MLMKLTLGHLSGEGSKDSYKFYQSLFLDSIYQLPSLAIPLQKPFQKVI